MATTGYNASGLVLLISNGASPPIFNPVFQLLSLSAIQKTRDRLDTNTHNSVYETGWMGNYIFGAKKVGGPLTGTALYDPANVTHRNAVKSLEGLFDSGEKVDMKILKRTSPPMYDHFTAGIGSVTVQHEMETPHVIEFTIEVEGAVVSNP